MPTPWYIDDLGFEKIWEHTRGAGVTIGILDSGIKPVSGFTGARLEQRNLQGDVVDLEDVDGHGTRCASLVASQRDATPGLAREASVIAFDVHGAQAKPVAHKVASALEAALDTVDILSCSFVLPDLPDALVTALARAGRADIPVVVAAGNDERRRSPFPEDADGVLVVGGHDERGKRLRRSRHGPWTSLFAPAEDLVVLTNRGGRSRRWKGTSGATAIVAATLALGLSAAPGRRSELAAAIVASARSQRDGHRLLDPLAFVQTLAPELEIE